jgi:hypothetical protein
MKKLRKTNVSFLNFDSIDGVGRLASFSLRKEMGQQKVMVQRAKMRYLNQFLPRQGTPHIDLIEISTQYMYMFKTTADILYT